MQKRVLYVSTIILVLGFEVSGQQPKITKLEPTPFITPATPVPTPATIAPLESPSPATRVSNALSPMNWTTDTWAAIAAIVAFVALIQPWLLSLWRRVFRTGMMDIHKAANIEVGYSTYGPTIGLLGTLRSRHKDMFVQWMKLRLVKKSDDAIREFEWKAFRNPKLSFGTKSGQMTEVLLEVPLSFMVSPLQPYRYNILFSDEAFLRPALPIAQKLQGEWILRLQKLGVPTLSPEILTQPNLLAKLRRAFLECSNSETFREASSVLQGLNYWQAGEYELTLLLQTSRPDKVFQETWKFTLSESELEKLQNNVDSILEEICGLPLSHGEYGFASAAYNS